MICGLLEDLFDGLAMDLEVAVKACLIETQDHHIIGLRMAEFRPARSAGGDSLVIIILSKCPARRAAVGG
jgi:hypothetical protein